MREKPPYFQCNGLNADGINMAFKYDLSFPGSTAPGLHELEGGWESRKIFAAVERGERFLVGPALGPKRIAFGNGSRTAKMPLLLS